MKKSFYNEKSVVSTNNIIALIYIKETLWIGGVLFRSLNYVW